MNGVGLGAAQAGRDCAPVGPCITGVIDLRGTADVKKGMVDRGGVRSPAPSAAFMPRAPRPMPPHPRQPTRSAASPNWVKEREREIGQPAARAARGRRQEHPDLPGDDPRPGRRPAAAGERQACSSSGRASAASRSSSAVQQNLIAATRAARRHVRAQPDVGQASMGHSLITVHPLGGCPMGADVHHGVVNHEGKVLTGAGGTRVRRPVRHRRVGDPRAARREPAAHHLRPDRAVLRPHRRGTAAGPSTTRSPPRPRREPPGLPPVPDGRDRVHRDGCSGFCLNKRDRGVRAERYARG